MTEQQIQYWIIYHFLHVFKCVHFNKIFCHCNTNNSVQCMFQWIFTEQQGITGHQKCKQTNGKHIKLFKIQNSASSKWLALVPSNLLTAKVTGNTKKMYFLQH